MRPWQFSKPKNPGFGISREFYVSVLSTRSVLPSLLELVSPDGANGSVVGFGVPLAEGKSKDALHQPLERGRYAIFSKDKKTCLDVMALSAQEAGFDPEAFARTSMAQALDPEVLTRVRGAWTLLQFRFQSHDAMVYPALDFLQDLCDRLATLCEGVVADPLAAKYRLPGTWRMPERLDPRVDAREHISFNTHGGDSMFTSGMRKFVLPELEMQGLDAAWMKQAEAFLILACQNALLGDLIKQQDRLGAKARGFEALPGGLDRARWEGIPVFELVPPSGVTSGEALAAWVEEARAAKRG